MPSTDMSPSKPGYLFVICSTVQLYSGTGTALFEWVRYAKDVFHFGLLMDFSDRRNFDIGKNFCAQNGIDFFAEAPARKCGAGDPGVARIAHHLRSGKWPYVEIVSWANPATNIDVVSSIPDQTKLIFTPHTQPKWTLGQGNNDFLIDPVLKLCVDLSDVVACVSPREAELLRNRSPGSNVHFLPNGVDGHRFRPMPGTRKPGQVLLVCDFAEHRKRTGLAIAAVQRVMKDESINFIMAGRDSDRASVPNHIEHRTRRMGYVSETELVSLYQQSSVFLLLSDYEAFGIPIAEALFCGARVVINDTPEMRSLFAGLPGVRLVENRDDAAVDAALLASLREPDETTAIRNAALEKFDVDIVYREKMAAIQAVVAGTRRKQFAG